MKNILAVLLLIQVGLSSSFAQKELSGVVVYVNQKGRIEPVPFANIHWQGTNYGTTSDTNGLFRLAVPDNTQFLITSFIQ